MIGVFTVHPAARCQTVDGESFSEQRLIYFHISLLIANRILKGAQLELSGVVWRLVLEDTPLGRLNEFRFDSVSIIGDLEEFAVL